MSETGESGSRSLDKMSTRRGFLSTASKLATGAVIGGFLGHRRGSESKTPSPQAPTETANPQSIAISNESAEPTPTIEKDPKPFEVGEGATIESVFWGDMKIKKEAVHPDDGETYPLRMRTSPELLEDIETGKFNRVEITDVNQLGGVDISKEDEIVVSFPVLVRGKDGELYWQVDAVQNDGPAQRDDKKQLYMQISNLTQPHFEMTVRQEYIDAGGTNGGRLFTSLDAYNVLNVRVNDTESSPVTKLSADVVNVISIPEETQEANQRP